MNPAAEMELFTNRLSAIAEEMGTQLQRTAMSVNVRERLDFSCAILNHRAELLINAAHIPVHLGSLGLCARLVLEKYNLRPGDVILTNHPKYGGSHLPDITLLAGVFDENEECYAYVINRAHHAEIGGIAPGSTPPNARNLAQEGVVIKPFYLVKNGKPNWEKLRTILLEQKYPTRAYGENIADINAALAALQSGIGNLQKLTHLSGTPYFIRMSERILINGETALRNALNSIGNYNQYAQELLDDGTPIAIEVEIKDGSLSLDFSGTSRSQPGNLWANKSIVYSAILYVLRLLCNRPVPLNEGLLRNVRIVLPDCFLNPVFAEDPELCPPVVGGNTETSQRLVDTLLKAFQMCSGGQGTMNNVAFGNDNFGYYETLGGGAGAGPGFDGCDAVHQHMTNTRITDCEELENSYPVRLHRYAVRKDSGGYGKFKGGDGIVRELEFLEPVTLSLVSQHRKELPFALEDGGHGSTGEQYLIRKSGEIEEMEGIDQKDVSAGDRFVIKTPGGSGYGKVPENK